VRKSNLSASPSGTERGNYPRNLLGDRAMKDDRRMVGRHVNMTQYLTEEGTLKRFPPDFTISQNVGFYGFAAWPCILS
jgi:hypothetical protein